MSRWRMSLMQNRKEKKPLTGASRTMLLCLLLAIAALATGIQATLVLDYY